MTSVTRNRLLGLGFAATLFAVDQWFKGLVMGPLDLPNAGPIEILPFFDLHFTPNPGISLGMLTADTHAQTLGLIAMTSLIALGVLVWMLREKALGEILALGLVLGGALGNIRDRVIYGFVVDYADLHFGTFRPFMIFNIADAAITIGVVIILARSLLSREKPDASEAQAAAPES